MFKVQLIILYLFAQAIIYFTALLIYVDDIMLVGNNLQEIQRVKTHLHNSFSIKDLGTLRYFLGFEISHSPSSIILNQRKYYLDLFLIVVYWLVNSPLLPWNHLILSLELKVHYF